MWAASRSRSRSLPPCNGWICGTSRIRAALGELGFEELRAGIYHAAPGLRIYVLVLSELPRNRETLLARLLGSGRILAEAIADLLALEDDAWEKGLALPWLVRLGFKHPGLTTEANKEAVMTEVREWFERYKKRLVRKGIKRGRLETLVQLCALRLGRPLSPGETAAMANRLKQVGETRLGEMLLGASPDALAAWLNSSEAA